MTTAETEPQARRLRHILFVAIALAVVLAILELDRSSVWLTYANAPPLWLLIIAIPAIVVANRRLTLWPCLFVLAGVATLPFSLAPGHTVVTAMWETTYLAAAAALAPNWARIALLAGLTWRGLTHVSSLALWGDVSPTLVTYGYGGIATALFFPAIVFASRWATGSTGRRFRAVSASGFAILAAAALFVSLASGSRAIYLALACASLVFVLRARMSTEFKHASLAVAAALAMVVAYDFSLPVSPVWQLVSEQTSIAHQVDDVASSVGNIRWRLAMWHQSLTSLAEHPFGTGTGSFTSVIHSYQRYPMLWSSSPHNYFIETVATGGPVRLMLLSVLLSLALVRSWRSETDWPWSASLVAIWIPLMFDVAGSNPVYMLAAFGVTAAGLGRERQRERPVDRYISTSAVLVGLVATLWWYAPCHAQSCAIDRYFAFTPVVDQSLRSIDDEDVRRDLVRGAAALYPRTPRWLAHHYSVEQVGTEAWPSFVERFPFIAPEYHLLAATALIEAGACERGRAFSLAGLEIFGRYEDLYGQARITKARHSALMRDLAEAAYERSCP